MSRVYVLIPQLVRVLCAVALLSVGFGHRVPVLPVHDAYALAYVLPDGTVPSLCLTVDEDGKTRGVQHDANLCDACLIAGAVLLPHPGDDFALRPLRQSRTLRPDLARFDASPVLISEAAPRAPPFAS